MAQLSGEEAEIRDFLAKHMHDLPTFVSNLVQTRNDLLAAEASFAAIAPDQGGPTAVDLLRRILSRRNLRGLDSFFDLETIETEFVLLNTGKAGFQPRADILARCLEDSRFFLFEIKRLVETERQAVTELSAYSHGLNNRFWNLTQADYAWVPVCTDWRTTVRAAFANEALFANRPVLPMRCKVTRGSKNKIAKVDLALLSLLDEIDEPLALSQFSWECFDVTTFEMAKKPSDFRTLVEFVSTLAARNGFSGVVLYGESVAGEAFPYPFVVALAVHNPFLGALKRRQLEIVRDDPSRGGLIEMRKKVKDNLFSWHDIDFRTMKDRDTPDVLEAIAMQAEENGKHARAAKYRKLAAEDYLSVQEIAMASGNRTSSLYREIESRLRLFCNFEARSPNLKGILTQAVPVLIQHVSYFGLMQEAAYERLQWEITHANKVGDGPVIGGIGTDPIHAICSPQFFLEFMSLMNFEHECQTDYCEDEKGGGD